MNTGLKNMKYTVYRTTCNDVYWNLATETYLMENSKDSTILFLWQNKPTVVIGKYQNPFIECDLEKMKEKDIVLSRRFSGGGAVFHDMGNLCFTLICPQESYDKNWNYSVVIDALSRRGIEASVSGRNDILVDNFKISGSAFQIKGGKACHHGTLLISCNLSQLPAVLTPNKQKLQSHGIKSVSSRVSNLSAIRNDITVEKMIESLIEAFREKCSCSEEDIRTINEEDLSQNQRIKEIHDLISSEKWLLGTTPQFTDRVSGRTSSGDVVIQMNVEKAIITDAEVFSDNLSTEDVEILMSELKGMKYDRQELLRQSEQSPNAFVSESLAILASQIQ